jgi:hypothetical protein
MGSAVRANAPWLAALLLASAPAALAQPTAHANAVLLNVTPEDLARIAASMLGTGGENTVAGRAERPARGITDLRYRAEFAAPEIRLDAGGRVWLDLSVLEASVRGSVERRILSRRTRCDDVGVDVRPGAPLDVQMQLRIDASEGLLEIVPETLRFAGDGSALELVKPSRCRNTFLPRWLLWQMGKPGLRRKIAGLDDLLLARARESAARLSAQGGPLGRLRFDEPGRLPPLRVQGVETGHGSLLVTLAGGEGTLAPAEAVAPGWVAPLAGRSFIGLSQTFLNAVLERRIADVPGRHFEPGGSLGEALRSEAILVLIPGLGERGLPAGAFFTFAFGAPPRIEFGALSRPEGTEGGGAGPATIRVVLADVEVRIHAPGVEAPLGTLEVDAASVTVAPYASVAGGVSFAMLENDWALSSRGIEFNEPLLAAAIQEVIFSEVFETESDPLAHEAFGVGAARFRPRFFHRAGEHLVVELGGADPEAPRRTDSLHASR